MNIEDIISNLEIYEKSFEKTLINIKKDNKIDSKIDSKIDNIKSNEFIDKIPKFYAALYDYIKDSNNTRIIDCSILEIFISSKKSYIIDVLYRVGNISIPILKQMIYEFNNDNINDINYNNDYDNETILMFNNTLKYTEELQEYIITTLSKEKNDKNFTLNDIKKLKVSLVQTIIQWKKIYTRINECSEILEKSYNNLNNTLNNVSDVLNTYIPK